ncbi:hypothetical protein DFH06DRAFT_1336118 [Mycena polygramma]|nr:hypothetical protein DFH06DRAFT_1336118 [Mycena polygramma]
MSFQLSDPVSCAVASALATVNDAANNVNAARVDFVAAGAAAAAAAHISGPVAPVAPVAQPAPPMVSQPVTHIRAHGPWEAGVLYTVVPQLPLSGVPDFGEKWFAITRGSYVGLTKNSAISLSAVTGVSTALSEKFNTQLDALNHFNAALITGAVAFSGHDSSDPAPAYNSLETQLARLAIDTAPSATGPANFSHTPSTPLAHGSDRVATPGSTRATSRGGEVALQTTLDASPTQSPGRSRKGGYAVFHGTKPGAYPLWKEAVGYVLGVPGSIYQGYKNMPLAQAAFDYAEERGWTRVRTVDGAVHANDTITTTIMREVPTPIGDLEGPNPLHAPTGAGVRGGVWYVVYVGVTPGVYASSLECSLNTLGLRCATYDSFSSRELAIVRFQEALADGRVRVAYPAYTASCVGTAAVSVIGHFDAVGRQTRVLCVPLTHFRASSMSSTYQAEGQQLLTQHELMQKKKEEQKRKTRERMARYRRQLKELPPEVQEAAKARARDAHLRYRQLQQFKSVCNGR